ncbi:MAG TPA: DNA topoisomerase III [Candidatus Choladousia intestinavium]|uniref:DNA topoisomerase 3 n=1 Tax=Candidatus Choladousia intestinavium TaxID=2840727 RepID=A0A9D1AAP1_9FIRM|nr:DNA topoisomerase III [Candidatus Choladousia intestinavium]
MKKLVIAEKPSVGRDIARVLGCAQKSDGYLEGKDYVVTWGLGHLVELQNPEDYDKKYKEWKDEDLPIMPTKLKTMVIPQTGHQYRIVKGLIWRKDIDKIVIATDAGREGELVARWILKQAENRKPCLRLWISSVTDKAIREGFSHLKDAREYDSLYDAAVSRAEADWLVGINATRALTCRYNAQLSCGRVQTPTLAMIAAREEAIRKFKPQPYYMLQAQTEQVSFRWKDLRSGGGRISSKEKALQTQQKISGKDLTVVRAERKKKRTPAPLLYDLTELQREADRRYGYSAKETLNLMQSLYEKHKVLTYPRTDSRYLTPDLTGTLKERLDACRVGPYKAMASRLMAGSFGGKLKFVDASKVSDHHAIIPTEEPPALMQMTPGERRIYDLVVRRFFAVMLPDFEYEETLLEAEIQGELFAARGKTVLSSGWKEVYTEIGEDREENPEEEELREQTLPRLEKGAKLKIRSVKILEGKTKPPARFRESTLLSAMENPVHYMDSRDKAKVRTLVQTGGLGTVATRADIIEKLFSSFLLEKKGQEIYTTSKARQLLTLVPEDLKKPEMTADWETRLLEISRGKMKRERFMEEIREYTGELLQEIRTQEGSFRHENLTNKRCPRCGKRLLAVNGKNAKLLVCQDRNCGYRETVSRTSNARCPVCHKRMELYGNGEQASFICACGYKEKLSRFKERRQKEGAGVSKKDVARYLAKQKKEDQEPLNNAFAAALQGIRLEDLPKDGS